MTPNAQTIQPESPALFPPAGTGNWTVTENVRSAIPIGTAGDLVMSENVRAAISRLTAAAEALRALDSEYLAKFQEKRGQLQKNLAEAVEYLRNDPNPDIRKYAQPIEAARDVNTVFINGNPALVAAAILHDTKMAAFLIAAGADLSVTCKKRLSPFSHAVVSLLKQEESAKPYAFLQFLITTGADPNTSGQVEIPLVLALMKMYEEMWLENDSIARRILNVIEWIIHLPEFDVTRKDQGKRLLQIIQNPDVSGGILNAPRSIFMIESKIRTLMKMKAGESKSPEPHPSA